MNGTARGKKPAQGEAVLDRAFRMLGCFGPGSRTLSLTALSGRAGLPKPTTLRIARKLVEWGALERTSDGEYAIGLRLLEVASLAPRGHGLRAAALPYMEDLLHATRQHVLLAVRDDEHAVLVERLSARGAGRVMYRVGGRMPLHSTGVGLVLLAYAPAAVQERVLAADLRLEPEGTGLAARDLRIQLAAVRREEVAVISRPWPEPMTSVACAITGPDRVPVAAVSVLTQAAAAEPAALAPAVIAVARAISRAVSAAHPG